MTRPLSSFAIFNPRRRSLLRGTLLVLGSFAAAFPLSGFPHTRATLLLIIPALLALFGTFDHIRCMQPRWSLYHGGVLLLIYMDLMAVCLILFFLLFPYLL
ncbi:MAG: permease [Acidobacteriaceae bacterium]